MKNKFLLFTLAMLGANLLAQPVLTYNNHALKEGTTNPMLITNYTNPNPVVAGENVVWDFSALTRTKDFRGFLFSSYASENGTDFSDATTELEEFNNLFYFKIQENGIYEVGSTNKAGTYQIKYEQPPLKISFPFTFGSSESGVFSGTYTTSDVSGSIEGTYEILADAYGTLILPDVTIENAIRVKNTKYYTKTYNNYSTDIELETYRWYHQGNRYPLLVLTKVTSTNSNGNTYTSTQAAFKSEVNKNAIVENAVSIDNSINIYPNPVTDIVNISYTLLADEKVNISLYDISGKKLNTLMNESRKAGAHTESIEINKAHKGIGAGILKVETGNGTVTQSIIFE